MIRSNELLFMNSWLRLRGILRKNILRVTRIIHHIPHLLFPSKPVTLSHHINPNNYI
jgi:hypothetical protein